MARDNGKYRLLQSALKLTGGTAAAGSPAAVYQDFKAGRRTLEKRKTARLSGTLLQRLKIPVYPFEQPGAAFTGAGAGDRSILIAYITRSSNAFRSKTAPAGAGTVIPAGTTYPTGTGALSNAELGYLASTVASEENGSFYAATLRCNYGVGVPVNRPNSGVTGRAYRSRPSTLGASIPFGRTETDFAASTQQNRFKALAADLKSGLPENSSMSVSLAPEEFSDTQRDNGFLT